MTHLKKFKECEKRSKMRELRISFTTVICHYLWLNFIAVPKKKKSAV